MKEVLVKIDAKTPLELLKKAKDYIELAHITKGFERRSQPLWGTKHSLNIKNVGYCIGECCVYWHNRHSVMVTYRLDYDPNKGLHVNVDVCQQDSKKKIDKRFAVQLNLPLQYPQRALLGAYDKLTARNSYTLFHDAQKQTLSLILRAAEQRLIREDSPVLRSGSPVHFFAQSSQSGSLRLQEFDSPVRRSSARSSSLSSPSSASVDLFGISASSRPRASSDLCAQNKWQDKLDVPVIQMPSAVLQAIRK